MQQLVDDGGLRLAGCVPQPPDPVAAEKYAYPILLYTSITFKQQGLVLLSVTDNQNINQFYNPTIIGLKQSVALCVCLCISFVSYCIGGA